LGTVSPLSVFSNTDGSDTCFRQSRSGRGAHVWFFFEEAIPAALARRLGSHVITETMEARSDIGLDSYDRFFPNQDAWASKPWCETSVTKAVVSM
jgi:hypothetical protein